MTVCSRITYVTRHACMHGLCLCTSVVCDGLHLVANDTTDTTGTTYTTDTNDIIDTTDTTAGFHA